MSSERPLGVTILAVLILLNSLFLLFIGLISFTFIFIFGVIGFFIAKGLFEMEDWAWWAAILIYGVSTFFDLLSFNLIGLIIDAVILLYLLAVANKFGLGERASPKYNDEWIKPGTSNNKDAIIENLFGKENLKSEYNEHKSDYSCPKCNSHNIDLMHDGSGFCNACKSSFMKSKKILKPSPRRPPDGS